MCRWFDSALGHQHLCALSLLTGFSFPSQGARNAPPSTNSPGVPLHRPNRWRRNETEGSAERLGQLLLLPIRLQRIRFKRIVRMVFIELPLYLVFAYLKTQMDDLTAKQLKALVTVMSEEFGK